MQCLAFRDTRLTPIEPLRHLLQVLLPRTPFFPGDQLVNTGGFQLVAGIQLLHDGFYGGLAVWRIRGLFRGGLRHRSVLPLLDLGYPVRFGRGDSLTISRASLIE